MYCVLNVLVICLELVLERGKMRSILMFVESFTIGPEIIAVASFEQTAAVVKSECFFGVDESFHRLFYVTSG